MAGIVGVIAGGDINDEAMDAAAGLIDVDEREFINSNVKKVILEVTGFLLLISFFLMERLIL